MAVLGLKRNLSNCCTWDSQHQAQILIFCLILLPVFRFGESMNFCPLPVFLLTPQISLQEVHRLPPPFPSQMQLYFFPCSLCCSFRLQCLTMLGRSFPGNKNQLFRVFNFWDSSFYIDFIIYSTLSNQEFTQQILNQTL